jgi:uncharacterized protein (TIGR02145 family)
MKALTLYGEALFFLGKNYRPVKCTLLQLFHFLIAANLSFLLSGCEKDDKDMPTFNSSLLTSTVWGQFVECGDLYPDPELYTCIFEPGGRYRTYYKAYETSNYPWSLKSDGTLIIGGYESTIETLTANSLIYKTEYCYWDYQFKSLPITKATTVGVSDLSPTSVKLHGYFRTCESTDVSFEYGTSVLNLSSITLAGVSFSGPTNKVIDVYIHDLLPGTVYFYRMKAVNASGTQEGIFRKFSTWNIETVTDPDNNVYHSVTIGPQVWMTENLKTTKYSDGSPITLVRDSLDWFEMSTPAFCWYKNDSVMYKNKYGALYNWYAVNTDKLCPAGWHVPEEQELTSLVQYLGINAGDKMLEGNYNRGQPLLFLETSNESGFSAQLAAVAAYGFSVGDCVYWSSTEDDDQNAWFFYARSDTALTDQTMYKYIGIPVRCLKD